jgi:hypothetical protein
VIGDPPSPGANHLIKMSPGTHSVVGARGVRGLPAAFILTKLEKSLEPFSLFAFILNS